MTALVLGKFMPPHRGHKALIDFARDMCGRVLVQVGGLASEPISREARFRAVESEYAHDQLVTVVRNFDENPQEPHEHPDFWAIWKKSLLNHAEGQTITHVVASESYGQRLADDLGAAFIPFDMGRGLWPVSGTMIRDDPDRHWDMLMDGSKREFANRVILTGAESVGKTTMTKLLAHAFDTAAVPEYARTYLEGTGKGMQFADIDFSRFARGMNVGGDRAAERGGRLIFADTDPFVTRLYYKIYMNDRDPAVVADIEDAMSKHRASAYIVLAPTVPWVPDDLRDLPIPREDFTERLLELLSGKPVHVVDESDYGDRLAHATAISKALRSW
jgi:HTH-type transcriptional regulator, transcriptional repressor of NAD biosynthesis genes